MWWMSQIDSVTVTNEFGTSGQSIAVDSRYYGIGLDSRSDSWMVIDFCLTVERWRLFHRILPCEEVWGILTDSMIAFHYHCYDWC